MYKWSLGILVAALSLFGITAPLRAADAEKSVPSTPGASAVASVQVPGMTPQSIGAGIVNMITKSKGPSSKPVSLTVSNQKKSFAKVVPVKRPLKGVKPVHVTPPPKTGSPQIRQEIQRILDLDQKIRNLKTNRTAQLQRIQEQARIHQRILNELETSRKTVAVGLKPPDKGVLLAQEKLRIIRETTLRNAKVVNELQKKSATKNAEKTAKEKPSGA